MRHKVNGRKFDRDSGSRKAMFRNLITQFFKHDRIVTTEAKAKETRSLVEKLITKARKEDLHARREVLRVVTDKAAVKRLFDVILAKVSDRTQGGYTRIVKIGRRKGDDAPLALLEIVEPGQHKGRVKKAPGKTKPKKEKKGKAAAPAEEAVKKEAAAPVPTKAEAPAEEPAPAEEAQTPPDEKRDAAPSEEKEAVQESGEETGDKS